MSDLNDPRVFLAAERTLLAWNRTAVGLMAFGFAIERFGLFVHMLTPGAARPLGREFSFWLGMSLVLCASVLAVLAVYQFRMLVATMRAEEIPPRYAVDLGVLATLVVAVLGLILAVYLFGTSG